MTYTDNACTEPTKTKTAARRRTGHALTTYVLHNDGAQKDKENNVARKYTQLHNRGCRWNNNELNQTAVEKVNMGNWMLFWNDENCTHHIQKLKKKK